MACKHCPHCAALREKRREERKSFLRAKVAAGICIRCNQTAIPGTTRCEPHTIENRKAVAARQKKLVSMGMCATGCGNKLDHPTSPRCAACREIVSRAVRAIREA